MCIRDSTGTATTGGTDLNAAEKITELSNGRLYNWRGQLKQGGFKFITTLGQALPSYNKGADNSSVVKRTSETEADDLFQINEAGLYYIYLSLKDMTCLLYTSPSPRDRQKSRMPSSA